MKHHCDVRNVNVIIEKRWLSLSGEGFFISKFISFPQKNFNYRTKSNKIEQNQITT